MEKRINYIIDINFQYSKILLNYSIKNDIKFIYASSASVYGHSTNSFEDYENENPLNLYAISKLMFDNYVRSKIKIKSQIVGLRYFNVYGKNESHKKNMASVIFHFNNQAKKLKKIKLFGSSHGFKNGEQKRDFVHVDDICDVNIWFMRNNISGIFNVGTGKANSFNHVAGLISKHYNKIKLKYVNFPKKLIKFYQPYTKANLINLRKIGYKKNFISIENGIKRYLNE